MSENFGRVVGNAAQYPAALPENMPRHRERCDAVSDMLSALRRFAAFAMTAI